MNPLVLLALLVGVAIALQGTVNGALSQRIGLPAAILANAVVTLAGALVWWLAAGRPATLARRADAPAWLWLGGVFGLAIIGGAAYAFPRLGAGATLALIVLAQLVAALAIDRAGWTGRELPLTPARLAGVAMLVVGAWLVMRRGG
jgi:transporter family-2 protein